MYLSIPIKLLCHHTTEILKDLKDLLVPRVLERELIKQWIDKFREQTVKTIWASQDLVVQDELIGVERLEVTIKSINQADTVTGGPYMKRKSGIFFFGRCILHMVYQTRLVCAKEKRKSLTASR